MTQRTDPHRPGAILPAEYTCWNDYALPSMGGLCPRFGIDCADPIRIYDHEGRLLRTEHPVCVDSGRCCVASTERHAARDGRAVFGRAGKCGSCGAHFLYGSMFRHEPTGQIVHMGHDCAQKYEMMFDVSAFELALGRVRNANAKAIARAQNAAERRAFFDEHPGLEAALELGRMDGSKPERIIADIAGRFVTYRTLSDKQVAYVLRLADEIRNPRPVAVERHCDAPIGKGIPFEGEIVSTKLTDGYMGSSVVKITVKVTTDDGSTWLAWGTAPRLIWDLGIGDGGHKDLRGRRIRVKATLERPTPARISLDATPEEATRVRAKNAERHFVFMQRPTATFTDVVDHPKYEVPKCTLGEPCRIIKKWHDMQWQPMICDGSCKNLAKKTKGPRAKKPPIATSEVHGEA